MGLYHPFLVLGCDFHWDDSDAKNWVEAGWEHVHPCRVNRHIFPHHGSLNVPIEHHPTIRFHDRYMVYNGYYKVMSNIPKMGHLTTPAYLPTCSHTFPWNMFAANPNGLPAANPAYLLTCSNPCAGFKLFTFQNNKPQNLKPKILNPKLKP